MKRVLVLFALFAAACSMRPTGERALEGQIRQITEALGASPTNGPLVYHLATLHDQAGNPNETVHWLHRLEQLGWEHGINAADFRKTKSAEFRELAARLNGREPLVAKAQVAFTVEGQRDLIPEGIAYDPVDDAFYLSSIYRRKIVRVDRTGRATEFASEGEEGAGSTLGLKVDPERRLLWVAASATEEMHGYTAAQKGTAALLAYDLRTGKMVRRLSATGAFLNDLALLADGTLFVTDSEGGRVFRVVPNGETLEPWIEGFQYPNGIALSDDGRRLYVADFRGVTTVSLEDKSQQRLETRGWIGGIDGLSVHNGTLVGIQNAAGNPRVVRIHLNDGNRVEVLESKNAQFDIPTTGVVARGDYYFIANSQLRAFTDDHAIWPHERLKDPVILRIGL